MHFNTKWDFSLHSFTLMSTWNKINVGCQKKKILFFVFDNLYIIFSNEMVDCHTFPCAKIMRFAQNLWSSKFMPKRVIRITESSLTFVNFLFSSSLLLTSSVLFKFFHIFILSRNTESISVKIRKKWNSCSFNWKEMPLSKGRY